MMTKVSVELEPWVRAIISETIAEHERSCPAKRDVDMLRLSFAKASGVALAAGAVGGFVVKLML